MKKINANWSYPLIGKIYMSILSTILLSLTVKYLNPFLIQTFGKQFNFYFYLFCSCIAILFIYGFLNRHLYKNYQKLNTFIKTNQLYIIEKDNEGKEHIRDSIQMSWIENKNKDKVTIRIFKEGKPLDKKIDLLGERLEAYLKIPLIQQEKNITFTDYIFETKSDKRLILENGSTTNKISDTTIQLTQKISYDISKVSHGLTIGSTGSGKTYFINSKILSYAKMNADIYICDPKSADLSLIQFIKNFPKDRVATTPTQICKILRIVTQIMEERYRIYFQSIDAFGKTFKDFNLKPVVIVFDEFTAFIKTSDKQLTKEAMSYLYSLLNKGRQMGITVEFLLQRADTEFLDGALREQIGCRVALGNLSKDAYRMIFSSNNEFKSITVKGGGYVMIDGLHTVPVYFESPLFTNNFNFIEELSKYYQ